MAERNFATMFQTLKTYQGCHGPLHDATECHGVDRDTPDKKNCFDEMNKQGWSMTRRAVQLPPSRNK